MGDVEGVELERLMRQHDELTTAVEDAGGWETGRKVETVLSGIGLAVELWTREADTLSGGEKNRVALARELIGGHDLLLLDEPTNHLDLEGIEWLENYLKEMHGAVLIISHDRRLLENSVERILELEHGELSSYPGSYTRYLTIKAERFEEQNRLWTQQQDFIRKEDVFIKKHMGSQRTAEAKGRAKKLANLVRVKAPHHDVRRPVIRAPEALRGGERVLHTEKLAGGYDGKSLFEDVDLRIGRGQRVGIVGPNGSGKTTLLKILAGRMEPLAGDVILGHGAVVGYYDQNTSHLRNDGTPATEIRRFHPTMTDREVQSHLARFLFRGKEVDKPMAALSGGERARLSLALLVLTKPSWLALDEPTNHLDLAGRTALEEMLGEFQGALVCISHDRTFLDGLCDHIVEVRDHRVREFDGNYSEWHRAQLKEQVQATEDRAQRAVVEKRAAKAERAASPPKAQKAKGKVRNPYKFEKLEKRIMKLEAKIKKLHDSCADEAVYSDPEQLRDTQYRAAELERELEIANEEWANW
jgi:ATP-binding cassette subfamily F protein 3